MITRFFGGEERCSDLVTGSRVHSGIFTGMGICTSVDGER